MEQIREMRPITQPDSSPPNSGIVWSNDPAVAGLAGTPEPVLCEFCGKPRYHKGIRLFGSRIMWPPYGAEHCDCPEAAAAYERKKAELEAEEEAERKAEQDRKFREKVQRIIGQSGMGARFLRRTFDNFQTTPENQRGLNAALRFTADFDSLLPGATEPGRNGLFISGPPGTGKTHLAAAIANSLISQGRPVICMTMIDLLERIKRTFSRGGGDEGDVLGVYKTVPLLVIDDIGKEPPTEWAVSTVYNIINARYEGYLPIIVTTNYGTDALVQRLTPRETRDDTTARATVDRLVEMCVGISLTGKSWRGR